MLRVWAPRGVNIVQPLELRYTWRYLVLAVDDLSGRLHWAWAPNMQGASLASILASWQAAGLPGLVWDGAGSHRGRLVRDVGPPTVIQPAAVELNPAERVFEEVHRRVEGRRYATLADKPAAVERYPTVLAAAPDRVKSLAGWAWIASALTVTLENLQASLRLAITRLS